MSMWFFKVLTVYFFSPYALYIAAMMLRNAKLPSCTAMKTGSRHLTAFLLSCRTLKCEGWILCLFFHLCWRHERRLQPYSCGSLWKSGTQTAAFQCFFLGNISFMFSVHQCLSSPLFLSFFFFFLIKGKRWSCSWHTFL